MNRLSVIAVIGLLGVLVYVAGDLLDPDPVPVAGAVELRGNVPDPRPTPDGFFIIPPRVVDLRQTGETDNGGDGRVSDEQGADDALDDRDDGADDLGGDPEDSPDDSPDDLVGDRDDDEGHDPDDD